MTLHAHRWDRKSVMVFIGPWACLYSWSRAGRFSNGSWWSSGWHLWREEMEIDG